MKTIFVATHLSPELLAQFAAAVTDVVFLPIPLGSVDLPDHADALLALPFATVGSPIAAARPVGWPYNLRWIQLLTVGLDYYPAWFLRDVVVTSGSGLSAVSMAEFAMAAILAAAKQIPGIWIKDAKDWCPVQTDGVASKVLGIYGFGALGEALAVRAQAFGMTVVATRRSEKPLLPNVSRARDMEELMAVSDHLVLAAPADVETRHIVNDTSLRSAKAGLHIINLARGSLIDERALLTALNEGRVSRATLDVLDSEPPPPDHALLNHARVFVSPHLSPLTPQTIAALVQRFSENIARFRCGKSLQGMIELSENGYDAHKI